MVVVIKRLRLFTGSAGFRDLEVRMRKEPKKSTFQAVSQFNRLVRSGLISGLKFSEEGAIVGANLSPLLTKGDANAVHKVVQWSYERMYRTKGMWRGVSTTDKIMRGYAKALERHAQKGNFIFLHHALERCILEGQNVFKLLEYNKNFSGESIDVKTMDILKNQLKTPSDVKKNLKQQLVYFRGLLRGKNIGEMVLLEEFTKWDSTTTKVFLTKDGTVYRDSVSFLPQLNLCEHWTIELSPGGRMNIHLYKEKLRK